MVKLKGPPPVLNKVAPGYLAAPNLTEMEIKGRKRYNRILNHPWQSRLVTLWLECTDITLLPDQNISMPNLKVLYLRDVIMVTPRVQNIAANKKVKSDNKLGLATILNACRSTLEYLELYTTDLSGMIYFTQDLPVLKKIRLVRSNHEEGLKQLLVASKNSLETILLQEMDLTFLEEFSTSLTSLKNIESENDTSAVTLIKNCSPTLEFLDLQEMDGVNNFIGFTTQLPALKTIKVNRPRGILGLHRLISLSYTTLEVLDLEHVNLSSELRIVNFEFPSLKVLKMKKCDGDGPVVHILRAAQHSIEHLETESLYCSTPATLNFDMPNLKYVTIGHCKHEVMRIFKVSNR